MSQVDVAGAAIIDGDRCLIARRAPGRAQAGRWEFPGGKVEPRETPREALVREIREELGIEIKVGALLGVGHIDPVRLRTYCATRTRGEIRLVDHDAVTWIGVDDVKQYTFADADVPILPALETRLRGKRETSPAGIHWIGADWSTRTRHRAAAGAFYDGGKFRLRVLRPERQWTVANLADAAATIADSTARPCVIGVDVSLGIPFAFGQRADLDVHTFREFLANLDDGAFETTTSDAAKWTAKRPFYRIPKGPGGRKSFTAATGGDGMSRRQVEIATHATETFAVSGIPGVVGAATRDFWRELRDGWGTHYAVWPFDGPLDRLLERHHVVFAEAYPKLMYGIVIQPDLPAALTPIAKTSRAVRHGALTAIDERVSAWAKIETDLKDRMLASEDDFDAGMLALGMSRVAFERRALADYVIDRRFEGALLGSDAVDLMGN